MKRSTIANFVIALLAAGAAGGCDQQTPDPAATTPPRTVEAPGATTAPPAAEPESGAEPETVATAQHGFFPTIPAGAVMCAEHRVPEMVCPFCKPEVVDQFGWCGGHDVPEALCTRCQPILIAAFKAEGDWCAEHGLPESQCRVCNPDAGG